MKKEEKNLRTSLFILIISNYETALLIALSYLSLLYNMYRERERERERERDKHTLTQRDMQSRKECDPVVQQPEFKEL